MQSINEMMGKKNERQKEREVKREKTKMSKIWNENGLFLRRSFHFRIGRESEK